MEPPPPLIPASTDTLPNDIIIKILTNLPAKSLLKFRCVCKNWNSIITSQTFMLRYSNSTPQRYIFVHFRRNLSVSALLIQPCTIFLKNSLSGVSKLEAPSIFNDHFYDPFGWFVVGSCNGLLCITHLDHFGEKLYLWNPSIRKHKILTATSCLCSGEFPLMIDDLETWALVGLGFDCKTNDFKILRIVYFTDGPMKRKPEAEVYSLRSDSWRMVEIPDQLAERFIEIYVEDYAYVYGAIHWLISFINKENQVPYVSILRFDVSEETFSEVKLPNDLSSNGRNLKQLVVFKGLLTFNLHVDEGEKWVCYVWTMNGSVWSRKRVEFAGTRFPSAWRCECIGDHLLFGKLGSKLHLVDPQTLQTKALKISRQAFVHTFTESLALL